MTGGDVVVTGVGVLSPLGDGADATWSALLAGRSAVRDWDDLGDYRCARAARIDATPRFRPHPLHRGRALAVAAARQAVRQAFGDDAALPARCGVYVGSTLGESAAWECAAEGEPIDVGAHGLPAFHAALADAFGLHGGPRQALATACAAGNHAVGAACDDLRAGRAAVALAGGVEPFSRLALVGFSRSRAMATGDCRPFDAARSGMLLGEGAAMFVLERADAALARGARPLAAVAALGQSCDAFHPTAPEPGGAGMARAMQAAIDAAGIAPADIDWVHAHGSGTRASDAAESRALRAVFGAQLPPVSASKGALGHALGAASAIELAICIQGLLHATVPPSPGHVEPDADAGVACTRAPLPLRLRWVLNNAFAFGGVNTALLLRPWAA